MLQVYPSIKLKKPLTHHAEICGFSLAIWALSSASVVGSPIVVSSSDWQTGENLMIDFFDGFATLRPQINFNGVAGDSTVADPGELEVGAHDPYRNGLSLQALEFAGDLQFGSLLGAAAVYNLYENEDNNSLDGEFEEIYATLDLNGLGVRGGRYLNAFGFQNQSHIHSWDFVDMPLVYGRLLGEHGLRTDGASALFEIPSRWGASLALSFGESVGHDHGHEEDHSHEEEEEEHGHGEEHAGDEDLLFDGTFVSTRLLVPWNQDDFNRWSAHVSLAAGENAFEKPTLIYATGISYEWLENGYEPGGARFRTSLELFARSWTASADDHEEEHEDGEEEEHEEHEEHGDEFSGTDFGFLAEAIYSPSFAWDLGGRVGYVSGDSEADLEERWRLSPALTWWANESKSLSLRLQYNLDLLPSETEQSVWLQLGMSWGAH